MMDTPPFDKIEIKNGFIKETFDFKFTLRDSFLFFLYIQPTFSHFKNPGVKFYSLSFELENISFSLRDLFFSKDCFVGTDSSRTAF